MIVNTQFHQKNLVKCGGIYIVSQVGQTICMICMICMIYSRFMI